jgi:hypothetical protein
MLTLDIRYSVVFTPEYRILSSQYSKPKNLYTYYYAHDRLSWSASECKTTAIGRKASRFLAAIAMSIALFHHQLENLPYFAQGENPPTPGLARPILDELEFCSQSF